MDLTVRDWSSLLGVLAFCGLLWRLVGTFTIMSSLERTLAVLLTSTVVIAAIGTYRLDQINAPASGVTPYIIGHRVLCLVVVLAWPKLMGRTGTFRERWGRKP